MPKHDCPDCMLRSIEHLVFSIEKSQKAYEMSRNRLIDLRVLLVNAEVRYREQTLVQSSAERDTSSSETQHT